VTFPPEEEKKIQYSYYKFTVKKRTGQSKIKGKEVMTRTH
jgi:hypothetical protein